MAYICPTSLRQGGGIEVLSDILVKKMGIFATINMYSLLSRKYNKKFVILIYEPNYLIIKHKRPIHF